jgi:hypothetical protein
LSSSHSSEPEPLGWVGTPEMGGPTRSAPPAHWLERVAAAAPGLLGSPPALVQSPAKSGKRRRAKARVTSPGPEPSARQAKTPSPPLASEAQRRRRRAPTLEPASASPPPRPHTTVMPAPPSRPGRASPGQAAAAGAPSRPRSSPRPQEGDADAEATPQRSSTMPHAQGTSVTRAPGSPAPEEIREQHRPQPIRSNPTQVDSPPTRKLPVQLTSPVKPGRRPERSARAPVVSVPSPLGRLTEVRPEAEPKRRSEPSQPAPRASTHRPPPRPATIVSAPEPRYHPAPLAPAASGPVPTRPAWLSEPTVRSSGPGRDPWPQAPAELAPDPWPSLLELPDDEPAGPDLTLRAWQREQRLQAEQRSL